jgi:uncharacterized protein YprB with RNaseH-like and TPR domain
MVKTANSILRAKPAGRIFAFDLETSSLDANRGHIICAAGKWVGEREFYTWRIDETPGFGKTPTSFVNDSEILRGLIPFLEKADAVMAYYGSGFDVPYVNTRAIINGMAPPVPFTVIDPWKTARSQLKLARNSMDSVSAAIGSRFSKTHLPWSEWLLAQYGDSDAITKLLKYNVNDIKVLEEVYYGLRPLMRSHPYLGNSKSSDPNNRCPSCGNAHTKSHDSRRTRSFEVFRRRCTKCGCAYETHRRKL